MLLFSHRLAKHVASVHAGVRYDHRMIIPIPIDLMQSWVALARKCNPKIPDHIHEHIANAYVDMRQKTDAHQVDFSQVSPRTLMSLIRLSLAMARLRLDQVVNIADVDEALRLVKASKSSLHTRTEGTDG